MMLPVVGSRITRFGSLSLTTDWNESEPTMFDQVIWYQSMPMLNALLGSHTIPRFVLRDFSGCSNGLPANTPETCTPVWSVAGSLTCTKNVATEGEISGSDGARKPRPQLARNSSSGE